MTITNKMYFGSFKTILNIAKKRKWVLTKKSKKICEKVNVDFDFENFQLEFYLESDDDIKCKVFWHTKNDKLNKDVSVYLEKHIPPSVKNVIFITENGPTAETKKTIKYSYTANGLKIDVFKIIEVHQNLSKHSLVPKHTLVPEQKKKILLEKFGVKNPNQLPKILMSDIQVKYIGGCVGDLVKIVRYEKTQNEEVSYRIVCQG